MALRMASPWKDPASGTWYLKERPPHAIAGRLKGQKVTLPVGDGYGTITIGEFAKVSLRTKEAPTAKERYRIASAALQAFYAAFRDGPTPLKHKAIAGLAGEVYRQWVSALDEEPGSPTIWAHVLRLQTKAREKGKLEQWVGPLVDSLLREKGLITDAHSRERLIAEVDKAFTQAAEQLKRQAEGDYAPDPKANRFPVFSANADAKIKSDNALDFRALFDLWTIEARQTGVSELSIKRWKPVALRFTAHTNSKALDHITSNDVIAYKDACLKNGLSPKTIRDAHLSALRTIFTWGVKNNKLRANPATDVDLKVTRKARDRERGYTDAEALLILKASLAYEKSERESEYLANVKRWCPWIMAFTGARVTQVTALTRESFRSDGETWTVRILPKKGAIDFVDVPLHEQLIKVGLIKFVQSRPSGHLFYDPKAAPKGDETQAAALGKWVKSILGPSEVQPSHGWRHRFTTLSRAHGLDYELSERIMNRTVPGARKHYGDTAGLLREIGKLPYYALD